MLPSDTLFMTNIGKKSTVNDIIDVESAFKSFTVFLILKLVSEDTI